MGYKDERETIIDATTGGRCYYLTVRLLVHPLTNRLVYLSSRLRLHPNYLTLVGAFFSVLCLYFFYTAYFRVAFVLYYIRTVCDYSDGALARYSNKVTKSGKLLDRITDEIFYLTLWVSIALETKSVWLAVYFFLSALLYRVVVDVFVESRVKLLELEGKRATVKQFFINHGILLGCGVCTILEFWVLFIFSFGVSRYYIIVPVFLCNLDLVYRIYEVVKYSSTREEFSYSKQM